MIFAWMTARGFLGLTKGLWLLMAVAALAALLWWLSAAETADDQANQQIGADKVVIEGQQTTLDQIGAAHEAETQVRSGTGNARYNECVRSAAEGYAANCERYRTDEPLPD